MAQPTCGHANARTEELPSRKDLSLRASHVGAGDAWRRSFDFQSHLHQGCCRFDMEDFAGVLVRRESLCALHHYRS